LVPKGSSPARPEGRRVDRRGARPRRSPLVSAQVGVGLGAGPSSGWIANDTTRSWRSIRAGAPGGDRAQSGGTPGTSPSSQPASSVTGSPTWARVSHSSADRRCCRCRPMLDVRSIRVDRGGSAFLQLFVGPAVSLELGGGMLSREPYQGFPRGGFFNFGVRIGSTRSAAPRPQSKWSARPRRRGDSLVVRFRFRGVHRSRSRGTGTAGAPFLCAQSEATSGRGGSCWPRAVPLQLVVTVGTGWCRPV